MLCFSGFELYPRWVPLQVLNMTKIALPIVVQSSGTVYPQLLGKQHL